MGIYLSSGFYDSFFQVMPFQLLGKVVPKVILRPPSWGECFVIDEARKDQTRRAPCACHKSGD